MNEWEWMKRFMNRNINKIELQIDISFWKKNRKHLQSSTNLRMMGFTILIISQRGPLQATEPEGKHITFAPVIVFESERGRLLLGCWSPTTSMSLMTLLFRITGSGTGMFKSWCTSMKLRSLNTGVASSSFSSTIFSGKPWIMSCSAFLIREFL